MNPALRFAYRRIPSFRREGGGMYDLYTSIYSRAHKARMISLHRRGRHGRRMANGACTWCGGRNED